MKIKNEKRRVVSEIIEDEEQITIIYDKEEDTEIDAEALAEFINEAIVEFYNEESEEQTEEDEVEEAEEEEVEDLEEDIDEDEDEFEIDEEEEEELDEEETEDEEEIDEIEEEEEDEESYLEEEDEERNIWDKKDATEKRFFKVETRVSKKGKRNIIEGHAAVFNELSEDLGGFREKINPGAFDDVLDNARTSSGTLKLSTDKRGLKYSFDVPDTTAGRDLLVSMKRGDITQSSFAFQVESDTWNTTSKGEIRTIEKVSRLFDVSPVSIPAYPTANDLSIAQRSRMTHKDKTKMKQESEYENCNDLLQLKINILKRK